MTLPTNRFRPLVARALPVILVVSVLAGQVLMPIVAHAQDDVSRQFWANLILGYPRSATLYFQANLETQQQVSGGEPYRSYSATPLVAYYPNTWLDLTGDCGLSFTNQLDGLTTIEIRPRVGVRLHLLANLREERGFERIPTTRLYMGTLLRLEWRSFHYSDDRPDEEETRFRARLETKLALNHHDLSRPGTLYIVFDGEAFVTLSDEQAGERFASKFRVRLGCGYRFSYQYRLELLYIGDDTRDTLGEDFSVDTRMIDLRLRIQF